ncbi:diguanylate cyclase [Pseudomonas sp. NA13]
MLLAERMRQALGKARIYQQKVAIAFIDLDGFKALNDSYGHDWGTGCCRLSRRGSMRRCVRAIPWRGWVAMSLSRGWWGCRRWRTASRCSSGCWRRRMRRF